MHTWNTLYEAASGVHHRWENQFMEAGAVSAALETADGTIYTGVSVDAACSLGFCAERNAIGTMLTSGEHQVTRLVCVMRDGSLGLPCGACRELLMQLSSESGAAEILTDLEAEETVQLSLLAPHWWGKSRFSDPA